MKRVVSLMAVVLAVGLFWPGMTLAVTGLKTLTGTVVSVGSGVLEFSTSSAIRYSANISSAVLTRKNGSPMELKDVLVGDKIQITGQLWSNNSISVNHLQDNSLYAHTGTFSGKIANINLANLSFVLESKTYGSQNISTNNLTAFKKNGSAVSFADLQQGMTATVKGVWDRSRANVAASSVDGTWRLIAINFSGPLWATSGNILNVVGNVNVMYGIDASGAKILNKNGQQINVSQLRLGDTLRISGKHLSGSAQVIASEIKDTSLGK